MIDQDQADAVVEAMLDAADPEAILDIGTFVETGGLDEIDPPAAADDEDDDEMPVDPESVKRMNEYWAEQRKAKIRAIVEARFPRKAQAAGDVEPGKPR